MASKIKSVYICSDCGYETPKWVGKCPQCGNWNTMSEEIINTEKKSASIVSKPSNVTAKTISEIKVENEHRTKTNIPELDRVLGGGIVKGSVS